MGDFVFDKGESSEAELAATEGPGDAPAPAEVPVRGDFAGTKGMAVSAIRTVYDPEIPVNIYDLGLIYRLDISQDEKRIEIDMTLTSPGCPVAGILPGQVEHAVRGALPEIEDVTVNLVWFPQWDKEMLSEAARLELGLF
jgi:FeS assembly SUF system protein